MWIYFLYLIQYWWNFQQRKTHCIYCMHDKELHKHLLRHLGTCQNSLRTIFNIIDRTFVKFPKSVIVLNIVLRWLMRNYSGRTRNEESTLSEVHALVKYKFYKHHCQGLSSNGPGLSFITCNWSEVPGDLTLWVSPCFSNEESTCRTIPQFPVHTPKHKQAGECASILPGIDLIGSTKVSKHIL